MHKKSFLKGFGTGVLFASVILGISCMIRTSDSFVRSRAKELGMVYSKSEENAISYKENNSSETETDAAKTEEPKATKEAETTKEPAETKKPTVTKEPVATKKPKATKTTKATKKPKVTKAPVQKQLVISPGDWSSDVSRKLEQLGVISSAKEFDKFLNDYGYSASISAGTYAVSSADSFETLAQKITGK